ncbi:Hypothetical protein PHPALM_11528 [Phytophthora palmivora]|uniref:Uncharacterized protein n=1 Tax=Phytophthora palmivora TaxID=4796 RepID=A0A2P4Y223_9STRA|nr:Hypothetical protein PHPALM_11528 [Phytophthora palmivora]
MSMAFQSPAKTKKARQMEVQSFTKFLTAKNRGLKASFEYISSMLWKLEELVIRSVYTTEVVNSLLRHVLSWLRKY